MDANAIGTVKFLFIVLLILLFIDIYILSILHKCIDKLEERVAELCSVKRGFEYIKEDVKNICEWHEDDVKKIQAEVLAKDILKEPDPEADIDKLMKSTW